MSRYWVARRLEELPAVAAAYRAGRVSYSKVRAITRVAEPEDGIDWVEHARHSTASQLEDVPAETPVASEPEPEPEPEPALRELLGSLDGERCGFPGCTRRKKLHAHHVRSWVDGGGTDLGNLVLVCASHHTSSTPRASAWRSCPPRVSTTRSSCVAYGTLDSRSLAKMGSARCLGSSCSCARS